MFNADKQFLIFWQIVEVTKPKKLNANNRYIYFGTEHSSFEKIHKKLNCNYGNIDNLVDNLVLNLRKLDIEKTI